MVYLVFHTLVVYNGIARERRCQEDIGLMALQATVEALDIEDMVAFLKEQEGPVALDVLVERYVTRLKERATAEATAPAQSG